MKYEIEQFNPCGDALEFRSKYNSFEESWNNCPRGDWMLWIAKKVGVDLRALTLAKARCAKTVLHLMKDDRSKKAIEIAESFGLGNVTKHELDIAAADAYAAYAAAYATAYATGDAADYADAYAAYAAAYATADDADYATAYAAAYAATAAYAAAAYAATADAATADAAAADAAAARKNNQQATADICREILTAQVLEKITETIDTLIN